MTRALVFDPYLATLGGGEHYALAIASHLEARHDVDVDVAAPTVVDAQRLHGRGFPSHFVIRPLPAKDFTDLTSRYDIVVAVTNHLPRPTMCAKSLLVIQFPFPMPLLGRLRRPGPGRSALDQYRCVVYSSFVQEWVRKRWHTDSVVLPPPVRLGTYTNSSKDRMILSVGRFFPNQHSKKQHVLLEAFRRLPPSIRSQWRLVLAGGMTPGAGSSRYLRYLRRLGRGLPIDFAVDIDRERLDDLLGQASLFWHATGFSRSPGAPEKAEHFGMSTVEAMSHGAVPLVFDDGGQRQIVTSDVGVRWRTVDQLVAESTRLISDTDEMASLASKAAVASRQYSADVFGSSLDRILRW